MYDDLSITKISPKNMLISQTLIYSEYYKSRENQMNIQDCN